MPTHCTSDLFGFAPVEGRKVVASFDGGNISSDAGALLLGATDRAIGLMDRFARCFHDSRRQDLIEHEVVTLVGQRIYGIALGYEDLNDHDELRHDPMMAILAGKLAARRKDCAPVAGKSTLNRLELSRPGPSRYHKIGHDPAAVERMFVELFLEAHARPPQQIILDLDATDDPLHGHQEGRYFHGYYDCFSNRPVGVKHFQAIHPCSFDVSHGLALLFGIDTRALPSWDPRTRWNNLLVGLAVSRTADPSNHANSPHPSSRERHLSTAGWNSSFLLLGLILNGFHAAAAACSRVHRNSVPSTHMRCIVTANRRARATIAFFIPRRLAICMAHALSQDHFFECIML